MTIPESQLETWSNQGAVVTAQRTHRSIRNALNSFDWSPNVTYDDYLQGSYRNSTNIRADSDVDLVAELTSTVYTNLTEEEKKELGYRTATYGWSEFREDVIDALTKYYETALVDTSGSKSIKVLAASGRLTADVVICATYRYYSRSRLVAEGMTFFALPTFDQIVNYPKLHYENGASKNSRQQTNGWYKPTIRMFKNARGRIVDNQSHLEGRFPSYFIECLLYNVPNSEFGGSFQDTYVQIVKWLDSQFASDNVDDFVCQNEMQYLFGSSSVQWAIEDAYEYIVQLINLWNSW